MGKFWCGFPLSSSFWPNNKITEEEVGGKLIGFAQRFYVKEMSERRSLFYLFSFISTHSLFSWLVWEQSSSAPLQSALAFFLSTRT